jgi:cytochrome c-type protein NapB
MTAKDPKAVGVAAAVVLAGAAAGFLTGTRPAPPPHWPAPAPSISGGRAPSYLSLRGTRRGPNRSMYEDAFDELATVGSPFDVGPQRTEDKEAALAARAARRAYDGAPPTVPHATTQMGVQECVACHEKGVRIANKVARRPSHEFREACSQCHVTDRDPRPDSPGREPPENTFVGLGSPAQGERAWPGAPPTIPHRTFMRTKCDSCHGVVGREGMLSTHPWRASCTQCHAPSAALDQQPFSTDREGT